jgi:ketosteroid isomerase-like protein
MAKEASAARRARRSRLVLSASPEAGLPARSLVLPKAAVRDTQRTMREEPTTPDLVELVRRMNDAGSRRDYDVMMSFVTPDFVFHPIATFAEAVEYRGRDAYLRFIEGWWEAWADEATWNLETTRIFGDAVVALSRFSGRAKASGVEVSGGVFSVYRFRDGKIASIEQFTDRDAAVRAAEERGG